MTSAVTKRIGPEIDNFFGCVCIPLGDKAYTIIDAEDFERVISSKWAAHRARQKGERWYVKKTLHIGKLGTTLYLHRFILGAVKGQTIDHINGDALDNRKCNLRFCSMADNNRKKHRSWGKSGFKGVRVSRWNVEHKYSAVITKNYQPIVIGSFVSAIDAAKAYDAAAIELFGDFAFTNKDAGLY